MDRQTLCGWVRRRNDAGVDGLKSQVSAGRARALTGAQKADLRALVIKGPGLDVHPVVRWRCVDLRAEVARRFAVTGHESTVGKWLNQPDPAAAASVPSEEGCGNRAGFRKNFAGLRKDALLSCVAGTPVEVWFQDEARIGQKGAHACVWAPVGSCPLVRDNRHVSAYLFGAICPGRAVGGVLVMPCVNTEAMNEHLKEISINVAPGAQAVPVCDGAGWHRAGGRLRVPGNVTLLRLPPCSPKLNPMENVWHHRRGNKLCATVWNSYEAIADACVAAWRFLINDPNRIRSIGTRKWARVSL